MRKVLTNKDFNIKSFWQYKDQKFLVIKFTIDHYTNINVYDLDMYTPFFGDKRTIEYLQQNPDVKILILEEAEVDHFFRRPILTEVYFFKVRNHLKNEVVFFFQGTGQENFMNEYLRREVLPYVTFVQSHTAPYNLMQNWVKTYSSKHYSYDELQEYFKPEYSLEDITIKKKFIVFAGKPRTPRLMMLGELLDNNLLESSYYNFGAEYIKRFKEFMSDKLVQQVMEHHGHDEYGGRLEMDFNSIDQPIVTKEEEIRLRELHKLLPLKHVPFDEEEDYYYTPNFIIPDPKLYKHIFLDLVLETFNHRGAYKDEIYSNINFFTEKIFKPVLTCRPFIVLGNKYYLRDLKQKFGFKTFNEYWDESYDDKDDIRDALPIITENLKYINSLSNTKLEELLYDMRDILKHNNKVAREFLEGEEPWYQIVRDYVDGKAVTWSGLKKKLSI